MSWALILDNNQYQFVRVISNDTKYSNVTPLEHNTTKKIKNENLIFQFTQDYLTIRDEINLLAETIDEELLWELAADTDLWRWNDLVELNFANIDNIKQLALFCKLTANSLYFQFQVPLQFKRLNQIEVNNRKLQLQQQQAYNTKFTDLYTKLINLQEIQWQIDPLELLHKPDKNSLEYKAVIKASKDLKLTMAQLFFKLGYIRSIEELLINRFNKHYFPNGCELDSISIDDHSELIPFNNLVQVFSIDDSTTTEIDDAFSLTKQENGWQLGIHIAAPALNHELLKTASERISTVYYPGHKITMLPENVIKHYSLDAGKTLPVVSIYFQLDNELNILNNSTTLERVLIKDNLRIEELEQLFNHANLALDHGYLYERELKLLYNLALKLEQTRGRPSVNQLSLDYNFSFIEGKIIIKPRVRGNPIDTLVSELMILANGSWGRMLTNSFIPAIYRVKQPMQPVTMTLSPNSHTGLNVDYYTWASSPLRRSVDLINQAQIISLINHSQALMATNYQLANVVENFDETYAAYLKFQDTMERYWSLRYFAQENIQQIKATYTYRNNVQLAGVPITLDLAALGKAKPAGTEIMLSIENIDFLNQTFDYKIINDTTENNE